MKKILIIIGTRPEAIKLVPVFFALRHRFNVQLISTGQHREMLQQIFSFFEVYPDVELNIMAHNQTLAGVTALLYSGLDKVIRDSHAHMIVVQGDTTTAMVSSMVGYYHQIPVAHVEAGLRSNNKYSPFPEEINRTVISLIADLHFAPTEKAAANLKNASGVHIVGNTVIDSLYLTLEKIKNQPDYDSRFSTVIDKGKVLILVTAHRRESFAEGLENICRAIQVLADRYAELQFVFPVHLNPNVRKKINPMLGGIPSVKLIEPVNYNDMVFLMSKAKIILSDSGGIQEEAPTLGVPLVVMRDTTERPEGIEAGCAVLAGTNTEAIVTAFERIYTNPSVYEAMKKISNPYGDGRSSQLIEAIIHDFL